MGSLCSDFVSKVSLCLSFQLTFQLTWLSINSERLLAEEEFPILDEFVFISYA